MDFADSVPVTSGKPSYEQSLCNVVDKKKILDERLTSIEHKAQICRDCIQKAQTTIQNYQPLIDPQVETRNGTDQSVTETARDLIQRAKDIVETQKDEFQTLIKELERFLMTDLYTEVKGLILLLEEEVKHWQRELQLKYAELFADVDLHRFSPCCAQTGETLQDLLSTDFPRLENAVNVACVPVNVNLTQLAEQFESLLTYFYQRTFVVVSQEGSPKHDPWNIKKGSGVASTPRITLRILGAATLNALGGVPVYACFVNESYINSCYDDDTKQLDYGGLEQKGDKIEGENVTKFVRQKETAIHEAAISIRVKINLKRAKEKRVYSEKYRLVFKTVINERVYWTLSLPMVVTTGGIQLCECLASIMWQCFSTDVFSLPTVPLPVLPWNGTSKCTVADMLQAKIRNISTRPLTEDDLLHLRHRLLSTSGVNTDTEIDINQFCSMPLPNTEYDKSEDFSFWKWFLSTYNLIETYLKTFWEKGWIEGFISKEVTERKLKSVKHKKQGLFLLRFSDWSLDSTQTKDAIYGKIATSVLVKNSVGVMEVAHVDRIGHDKLIKDSLQHILSTTQNQKRKNIYRYIYPSMEKCEKLKEENVTKAPAGGGYLGVQNAYIADLERIGDELCKLDLKEKFSVETDSDSDDDHEIDSQSVTDAKKPKMSLNNSSVLVSRVQENDKAHCSSDVTCETSGLTMPGGQMLTNPIKEHDYAQAYARQGHSNINVFNKSEVIAVERSVVSAQSNANDTILLPTVINDITSSDNVAKNTPLNPVTQNQNAADSDMNTTENIIAQTSCGWVRINECKSDVNSAYDHENEAVLGTFYGEKRAFDMLDFDTCQNGECAIESQVSNQAPDANHEAHKKVMNSFQGDQQSFDNTSTEQNLMEIACSYSNQKSDQGSFTNQTLVADEISLNDVKNNESINDLFNGNFDDIFSSCNITQTINSQDVHTQTETPPETPQNNTEHFEGPIQDAKMMNIVRSYLESCPNEKLAHVLPKNVITKIITCSTFFQQLTNIEYLTPVLANLPEDKKERVMLALQSEKNESRP